VLVPLPPLPEQQRIVSILATWDSAIEKTERLVKAKRVEMVGLARAAVACSAGRRSLLGDMCVISKGAGLSKDDLTPSGAHPCILYGELHTTYGEVVTEVRSRTDSPSQACSQRGDILIPSSSETSEDLANATALNQGGVLLGGDINILRPKHQGEYDAEYLAYYLRHIMRRDIARLTQGNAIVHLYGRDIALLEVTLPEFRRQSRVASAFAVGRREIAALEGIRNGYLTQRRGVAHVLLRPEMRAVRHTQSAGRQ
jgi:type I restriction enzyme S subunit